MMKQYLKCKDSGIEWLEKIPEHWEEKKLKYCSEFINGYAFNSDSYVPEGIPLIRIGDVKLCIDLLDTKKLPFEYLNTYNAFKIQYGDILLALTGATIGKSAVFDLKKDALLNQRVAIIRPKTNANRAFLRYIIDSDRFRKHIDYECDGGAQENIGKPEVGNFEITLPPLPEQQYIATYLDRKTSQIDSLVEKKQKMIELLKEERTATINHAVTKGLNPKVKMKDSCIEWLGEIPEHWGVKRLKYVAEIKSSNVDKKSFDGETKVLLCNYLDVYKNEFIDSSFSFMEATANENEIEKFTIKKEDVLVTKDSETPDDIAKPAFIKEELKNVICGYHLAQIRTNKKELIGEFLFRLFQSKEFNVHFEVSANGITRFGLSVDSFEGVFILLPPIEEQNQIVKHIETSTRKIDVNISKIGKEIELMLEYRTALISEAVTGKIDVRNAES